MVPVAAVKNQGVDELIPTAIATAKNRRYPTVYDFCSPGPVHPCIHAVIHQIKDHGEAANIPLRFVATKLIEDDADIRQRLELESEHGIDALAAVVDTGLTNYGLNPVVHSSVIDGIFARSGNILIFLYIIMDIFFFLSILQDTGYIARVAFFMDQLLRKMGLSDRSIVPCADRIWLLCTPYYGDAHPRPGPWPEDDHSVDVLYELLRQDSHLRRVYRRLLPKQSEKTFSGRF